MRASINEFFTDYSIHTGLIEGIGVGSGVIFIRGWTKLSTYLTSIMIHTSIGIGM